MIVTIPKEPIDESLLPTLTFYHGSIHKLDKILPTAFDVGNKLRDARWSVFMFRKKEYAKYYAMTFMIEQTIKSLKRRQTEFPPTMGWLEKTGINSYEFRGVAMDKNYDEIKNLCLGKKYYVYTLEVPLSTSLDVIGTNPTLPEYTYGGIPKTVKRDEYTITEKDFDKLHKRVSKEEYDRIHKEKPFRKPIVSQSFRVLQLDDHKRSKDRRIALVLIKQGDLKPGDDLGFLQDSNIYYRVTYKGEGIYQAVKKVVSKEEWKEILNNPKINWLPKPPEYGEGYESYFTKDGFSHFWDKTRKIFYNILDDKYIKLSQAKIDNKDIVYKDKYQVVVNRNVVKEETDMLVTESRLSNGLYTDDYDDNMYYMKNHVHSPKDLNKIMNGFRYGYFTKEGEEYVDPSDFSKYTTMEPHDTIKFCLGVCWDFAETEAYLFNELFKGKYKITNKSLKNGTYSLYYMEHDDSKGMSPTHTWLAYMENDKVYLFESSWFKYQGIHEFDSEMEIIEFYDKAQRENESRKGNKLRGGIVIKYLPVRRYGLEPLEFMRHIYKCNTSRLMKVSPEFPIPCKIQPMREDTDMLITESLQNGNNILFSEDDIYCNTEKWDNGEAHVIFIMGLSGSGKSTLAKKMKDKNKCQYVSTDTIAFSIVGEKKEKNQNWEYIEAAEPLLAKFMRANHLQPDFMRCIPSVTKENPVLSKKDEAKKQEWVDKYLHWLCFEQKEKVVIEGGHACVTLSKEKEFRDLPIIFKGTSLAKSMMRRLKRDFEDGTMSLAKLASRFNVFYTQYGKMLPEVNAARKAVITDDNYKYQHESTSITSNEITSSKLPYKCEIKQCHYTYNNGEPKRNAKSTPQLILHKDGKNWRVRAEMLLFKEGKLYLVKQNKVNQYGVTYKLPGGGIDDPQEGIEETASRECKEEVRIIPTNVVYTGIEVQHIYDKIPDWHKAILHPEGIYYDGSMTFICTGEYKQEYKSYVKKMDQQDEMTKGHFYTYEQVEGILSKEHKALFKKYLKDYRRLQFMKEEFIPEIDRSFLDMDISCLVEDKK